MPGERDGLSVACGTAIPQSIGLFSLREMDEVTSTNDVVKAAIDDGAPEGFAVRASVQSGGYGRHGRHWASPAGGLYLSVLLRPSDNGTVPLSVSSDIVRQCDGGVARNTPGAKLPTLSLAVGLAVRRALVGFLAPDEVPGLKVKWPNDLVVEGRDIIGDDEAPTPMFRKICGISLEQHHGAICVGVGVNVFPSQAIGVDADTPSVSSGHAVETTPRNEPVYLADIVRDDASLRLSDIASRILTELTAVYKEWLVQPFSAFASEYRDHSILQGRFVRVERNDGSIESEGIVTDVDEWGRLVVGSSGTHETFPVSSGEAHVIM